MTLLLTAHLLAKSFGSRTLFSDLSLSLFSKDRIGLIGRNGSGKSTLLKIIMDHEKPDSGTITTLRDLKMGYVPQEFDFPDLSLFDVMMQTLTTNGEVFEQERLCQTCLSRVGFRDYSLIASKLSGGWKKRLACARALVTSPLLLLIDEPTNHLDLEGICWLEKFLLKENIAYLLVSHDRYFLEKTTNKIIDIDPSYPKGFFSVEGSYSFFVEKRREFLEGQIQQAKSLSSKARLEVAWLAKSPKARTTKSKARVEDALELLSELSEINNRNRKKEVGIEFSSSERETEKLLVAKNICKKMGEKELFKNFDLTLLKKSRIGIVGANGSGKTTLLRLLAGEILPDQGTIKTADNLKIVYFDQHRLKIPAHYTLRQSLSLDGDYVNFRGRIIHIHAWCKRFLFSEDILDMPIEKLSGGERARILIAALMLKEADLLLLDEPTNDIDIATLEIFEESLLDFSGAVVLITHDRAMIERVCNSILVLEDSCEAKTYSSYSQWQKNRETLFVQKNSETAVKDTKELISKAKLSYLEKKELQQIEKRVLQCEELLQSLHQKLEEPNILQSQEGLSETCQKIAQVEKEIDLLYSRFEELDRKGKN